MDGLGAVVEGQLASLVGGGLPGAFVFVEDSDGSWMFRSTGTADRSTGRPIDRLDRYRIGSTTKTFTAVVVLQLVSEGKVELHEPVVRRLPELHDVCDPTLTVEHLLRMRSGLFDFEDDPRLLGDLEAHLVPHDLGEVLELGLAGPTRFRPGERFEYCNTNFCVLERIVERATGRSLGRELDQRIFGPLGLTASSYPAPEDLSLPEPFIHGYHWTPSGWRDCSEAFFGRGDGAIVSTAPDAARFLRALLHGDLVPTELLAAMRTVVEDDPPAEERYGLGLIADELPHGLVWGHSGGGFGYRHWPYLDLASGRLIITMVNGTSSFRTSPTRDLPQLSAPERSLLYTT